MKDNENIADLNQALEQQLIAYFSLYKTEPVFKSSLQKQLIFHSAHQSAMGSVKSKKKLLPDVFYQPRLKWVGGILFFIIVLLSLIAIHPVRAFIERSLDIGYIEGTGFVRVSETNILNGPIYSIKHGQTIGIDKVVADPKKTQIWFHLTGTKYSPEDTNGEHIAFMEVDGQQLSLNSWTWDNGNQKGALEFSYLGITTPSSITLHISPDWSIPIRLRPMGQISAGQSMTIYPDICQAHLDVELCLRAFVSDSTGYHLWLSAASGNPIFYLQTLDIHNPLAGEDAILMDSSGHQLDQVYPSQLPLPIMVSPVISDVPKEVSTTLSFERSTNDNDSLELLVAGLTSKTPADDTIVCELGKGSKVGDRFACEKSISIAGQLIRFHEGKITQERDGIHLTLLSDPIQATDGFLLTFVDFESLETLKSSFWGTGFYPSTNQLEIWQGLDSLNAESRFAVKITSADLTILEPFKLTWKIKP
jgi:hypothetical protein